MNKIKFNPNNARYYSEDFIKCFECGVERQFNADMAISKSICEKIKHRIGNIAMMCDENDKEQLDILVELLALINDINIESEEE